MDYLQSLTPIITGASFIGGALGVALAYKRKTDLEVLRASNLDYKDRNEQLEQDNARLKKENAVLEAQRVLPFEKLTKLIVTQHSQSIKSMSDIITELGNIAKSISEKDEK